ncbi:hypothetical protein [Acidianus sp. HS-5]|uniref:hypothetical protein n=1 Tax=Acidianus sp. HS-5 TaxID=2886040 RepID=UPI001F3174EE|nr:hypothetical protein [Acidianus sp. HS-5]BDC18724.1 hypothetical protein HS5_16140 [Acidianus sp. HS-5]
MKLRKRDLALLSSVAKYYLQYKDVFNLNDILNIFEGTEELPVDNYTLSYIYYYILYILTKEALDSAEKAKKDRLTYREFSIEYSQELLGELSIDRTIQVHHLGLVAYHTYVEGVNAPEFLVFGYLLRRIYEIIKEKKTTSISNPVKYFDFVKDFDRAFNALEKVKDEFPEGYYRDEVYTDPEWLKRE